MRVRVVGRGVGQFVPLLLRVVRQALGGVEENRQRPQRRGQRRPGRFPCFRQIEPRLLWRLAVGARLCVRFGWRRSHPAQRNQQLGDIRRGIRLHLVPPAAAGHLRGDQSPREYLNRPLIALLLQPVEKQDRQGDFVGRIQHVGIVADDLGGAADRGIGRRYAAFDQGQPGQGGIAHPPPLAGARPRAVTPVADWLLLALEKAHPPIDRAADRGLIGGLLRGRRPLGKEQTRKCREQDRCDGSNRTSKHDTNLGEMRLEPRSAGIGEQRTILACYRQTGFASLRSGRVKGSLKSRETTGKSARKCQKCHTDIE